MLVPVYDIKNCGPRHRFSANGKLVHNSDKINLQNLPSRGANAKVLKKCMAAPKGYALIETDSAQIEARILAWLAGQTDVVTGFANKEDVYKRMAAAIYNMDEADITKESRERFVGKQTILGCGYGMGANRFKNQLATFNVVISLDEAQRIIDIYRSNNSKIVALWNEASYVLKGMINGDKYRFGGHGVLAVLTEENAIKLPSGLLLRYDELKTEKGDKGPQYTYKTRYGRTKIYGGKCVENVCQAIARCVIAEQMLRIAKRYKVVLTVHDSVVLCVKKEHVKSALPYIAECMRWAPEWAKGLPLDCDMNVGKTYGECEEVEV